MEKKLLISITGDEKGFTSEVQSKDSGEASMLLVNAMLFGPDAEKLSAIVLNAAAAMFAFQDNDKHLKDFEEHVKELKENFQQHRQ